MTSAISVGFPKMHKEKGERRDFLPELFRGLKVIDEVEIFLEDGYGSDMGFTKEDYLKKNSGLKFASNEDIYGKDMVIVLRCPEESQIRLMKENAVLFSMLHYETRASRNLLLLEKKLKCFSMDSLTDDDNVRMLVNYRGTSRAGAMIAFYELKKRMPDFYSKDREAINITIIGLGAVGLNAAKAFEEFSDKEFLDNNYDVPGVIIRMIPRSITKNEEFLRRLVSNTDILVDASRRMDPASIIIPNKMIGYMPLHAVILDLCADPYNENINPIQVKGIEGIPTGTLDKYIIEPDDEIYDTVPKALDTANRRLVVSCNAWPGVDAADCMRVYGNQILPFLKVLFKNDITKLSCDSEDIYERALCRASLDYYMKHD